MAEIISQESGSLNSIGGYDLNKMFGKKETKIDEKALYAVNWGALTNVNDLVKILASIGFVFGTQHGHFQEIKHLLDLENPIYPQQQPQNEDFLNTKL